MRKRTGIIILVLIAILILLGLTVVMRMKAPPRAARLLPSGTTIVYFNLEPVRRFAHFDRRPVKHSPAYQKFIDATGFVFERDLDQAAFAVERMPNPNGPNGAFAFSEVFVGKMNERRMRAYLGSIAQSKDSYDGRTIYRIPSQQRTVRVAILSHSMVAVSNTPTPSGIHSILDHFRSSVLPFSGPSLLTKYYSKVPLLSPAWAIGRVGGTNHAEGLSLFGFHLPIASGSVLVGSLRWTGALHLKVEDIAPDAGAAENSAGTARSAVALLEAVVDGLPKKSNPGLRELVQSARIEQHGNHATLTATVPDSVMTKLLQTPNSFSPPASGNPSSEHPQGTGPANRGPKGHPPPGR